MAIGTLPAVERASLIIPPTFRDVRIQKTTLVKTRIDKTQIHQVYYRQRTVEFASLPSIRQEAVRPRTQVTTLNDADYRVGHPYQNRSYDRTTYSRNYTAMPGMSNNRLGQR